MKKTLLDMLPCRIRSARKKREDDWTFGFWKDVGFCGLFFEWLSFQIQFSFCSTRVPEYPALVAKVGKCLCSLTV